MRVNRLSPIRFQRAVSFIDEYKAMIDISGTVEVAILPHFQLVISISQY